MRKLAVSTRIAIPARGRLYEETSVSSHTGFLADIVIDAYAPKVEVVLRQKT